MNIFLSSSSAKQSIQELDDLRLQKQLVEVYQLLTLAIKEQQEGKEIKAGHYHHPVYLFYKDNPSFLCSYGRKCCIEYEYRFDKEHVLKDKFSLIHIIYDLQFEPDYIPYYMEGSKGQPNYIRTITDVEILFQSKLISKWQNDKKQPKWSNRKIPIFYQNYLNLSENDKNKYWEYILNIKRKHYGKS